MKTVLLFDSSSFEIAVDKNNEHRIFHINDGFDVPSLLADLGVQAHLVKSIPTSKGDVELWEQVTSTGGTPFQERFFWQDPVIFRRKMREFESKQDFVMRTDIALDSLYFWLNRARRSPSKSQMQRRKI